LGARQRILAGDVARAWAVPGWCPGWFPGDGRYGYAGCAAAACCGRRQAAPSAGTVWWSG